MILLDEILILNDTQVVDADGQYISHEQFIEQN